MADKDTGREAGGATVPGPGYWAHRFNEMVNALGSDDEALRRSATTAAIAQLGGPAAHNHPETRIVVALREFPDELADKLGSLHEWVKEALAANQHAPEWLLRRLAAAPEGSPNFALAKNPACPADILAVLAHDPDELTRAGVARNPATPADVLSGMVDSAEGNVTQALARRVELPTETRNRLGSSMPGGDWPCRVCGAPGGAVVIVRAEPGFQSGRPITHEEFTSLFPEVVASWCAEHAGRRYRLHKDAETLEPGDETAPDADWLPDGLEMFWRRAPNHSFSRSQQLEAQAQVERAVDRAVGVDGWAAQMASPYNMWGWVHCARSLLWWLAGRGRVRCGEESAYLTGGWDCDQQATAVLGDSRWGADYAVCDTHAADPSPGGQSWAGCHAEWDPDGNCWKRPSGTAITRPQLWHPGP